jgi:electron transport complex protein RnfD
MSIEKQLTNTDTMGNEKVPVIHVAPSPHFFNPSFSTRRMMIDVFIALLPVIGMAVYLFRWYAIKQIAVCLVVCLGAELLFTKIRKNPISITDCSAAITGLILGLSLPVLAPWYVGVIASVVAIGIGKIIFGGLGMNIFNPAMVGRSFVMISFAGVMAASGYVDSENTIDAMTMATPLNAYKQAGITTPILDLLFGMTNGSPGEVSGIACLIGGLYLCIRRTASWEIPAGIVIAVVFFGGMASLLNLQENWTILHHLMSGALLFGAFFIATDPVTSPLTPKGKFVFGFGTGALIMLLRIFSGYPEGVMFAILFMNALTPLIDRWLKHWTMGETKQHSM